MDLSGIFFIVGLVAVGILLIPALLAGVFVIVVVANRAEPDPSGRRPAVVYGFATAFLTLFITLFATAGLVASLSSLIGSHRSSGPGGGFIGLGQASSFSVEQHPIGDAAARGAVLSIIVALVAGVVYLFHLRAAARASGEAQVVDPVGRVRSSYISAVSFVCVLIAIVSTVVVAYDVFRLIAPGVFSPGSGGGRAPVVREMLPSLYLAVAATALLLMHLRHTPPPLRPRFADRFPAGPLGTTPRPQEPVLPPPST